MQRRTFLKTAAGAGMVMPAAQAAAQSKPGAGIRLGFDTWVFNGYGWTAIQYLDYAASQQLDTVQMSDLPNFESLEPAYLARVKAHAAKLGILIEGGLGCICPTAGNWRKENGDPVEWMRKGLRANHAVGTTVMRTFMGGGAERNDPIPFEKHVETTLKILRTVRSEALDLRVKIGIENHGDFQAWELRDLIEAAGKDFVGACLDTGNPVGVIEDPMVTLEILGPYAVTTHFKDFVLYEHPRGAVSQSVPLGEGTVDYPRFMEGFKQICPNCSVQLEILTGGAPRVIPYLEPDFWKAFPKARASEFARFVALAKKGQPYMGTLLVGGRGAQRPPEYAAAMKEQQRIDLERSLAYAKKSLNLGLRGRS